MKELLLDFGFIFLGIVSARTAYVVINYCQKSPPSGGEGK